MVRLVMLFIALLLLAFGASTGLVYVAIRYLRLKAIYDNPNARSSHTIPTPRGGGLGLIPVILAGLLFLYFSGRLFAPSQTAWAAVIAGLMALALVSWLDDRRTQGLSPLVRFSAQFLAVLVPVFLLPPEARVLDMLPLGIERAVLVFGWLWFVNLYNFMDGINGITGVQTIFIAIGVVLLLPNTGVMLIAAVVIGACAGFLVWNLRPQAKIFLGDIGSIGLGYLMGFLLIVLASGNTASGGSGLIAALILPLYYLMDATITLLKRMIRREKFWQPHRTHFYQMATRPGGLTHLQTVGVLSVVNFVVLALKIKSVLSDAAWLAVAVFLVSVQLLYYKNSIRKSIKT